MKTLLIAVGGNALYDKASGNNLDPKNLQIVTKRIVGAIKQGYLPVVTFGNGPQVGNLLDMAETSARMFTDPVTLDTCVSWTQGEIGYHLMQAINNQLASIGLTHSVMAVNTTVVIDPADPAMQNPSKPVGRFISPEEAQQLYEERGWVVGPDANRGFRRLVPSPLPQRILEATAIQTLINAGHIVLCCGGGGLPVAMDEQGNIRGVEAVIDKDFTSCLLAKTLKIDNVMICTEVEYVYLNFGKPNQTPLRQVSVADAKLYLAGGQFSAGSMGPKVAAMIDYLDHGGKKAFITNLDSVETALAGHTGTEIYS